jgi:ATP-dependent Zn protease
MFDWIEVRAKAYHEAGHTVAAMAQGLNLAHGGMLIDSGAGGVTHLCVWEPGNQSNSDEGISERRATIVVLFAGKIAQLRFDSYYDDSTCWSDDFEKIERLIEEMEADQNRKVRLKKELYVEATALMARYWSVTVDLAEALLRMPETATVDLREFPRGCGQLRPPYKHLSESELRRFFASKGIPRGATPVGA